MGTIIKDIITFLRHFWSIVKEWVLETRDEHAFTNVLIPIICVLVLLMHYFGILFTGGFHEFTAWALFFVWVGMNLQGLKSVYKKLKEKNYW